MLVPDIKNISCSLSTDISNKADFKTDSATKPAVKTWRAVWKYVKLQHIQQLQQGLQLSGLLYVLLLYNIVAERTLYHIFTQWGWFVPFCPNTFPRQIKSSKSPPNFLFLRIFQAGQTYFLSSLFIEAEPLHYEESHLIKGPLSLPHLTKGSQLNIN